MFDVAPEGLMILVFFEVTPIMYHSLDHVIKLGVEPFGQPTNVVKIATKME